MKINSQIKNSIEIFTKTNRKKQQIKKQKQNKSTQIWIPYEKAVAAAATTITII